MLPLPSRVKAKEQMAVPPIAVRAGASNEK
jgi:hypothetical protein